MTEEKEPELNTELMLKIREHIADGVSKALAESGLESVDLDQVTCCVLQVGAAMTCALPGGDMVRNVQWALKNFCLALSTICEIQVSFECGVGKKEDLN